MEGGATFQKHPKVGFVLPIFSVKIVIFMQKSVLFMHNCPFLGIFVFFH